MATIDWLDRLFQVSSVFGRTGAVVATAGDYSADMISYDFGSSNLEATDIQSAIDEIVQSYADISVTELSGTYNALVVNDFEEYSSASFSAVNFGTATINGILAPASGAINSQVKLVRLPYGTFTTTLVHNSGSAAAGNKIITATGGNIDNQGPGNTDVYVLLTRVNGNWFATRLGTRSLSFGTTSVALSATAPTTNQLLAYSGSQIIGLDPGSVMSRMTASNSSTTALTFSANQRLIWNGSTTPSFTFSSGSAVDGATITIFFPASLGLTTFTLSSDLDPTGTVAYAFDSGSAAYRLTAQYLADGPSIVCSLRKVTDL
jgi:hypothetical protein